MSNHQNRSGSASPAANPTPEIIRGLRRTHALTTTEAGALVFSTARAWQRWESGHSRMHPAIWQWFRHEVFSRSLRPHSDTTSLRLDLTHLELAQLQTLVEEATFAPYGSLIIKVLEALKASGIGSTSQSASELPDCMLLRRQAE